MNPLPRIALALLAAALVSCGSSPQVRYYSLEPAANPETGDEPGAIVVGLGPLRVPEYLRRSQIVTRGRGTEIEIHEFARWAEPVDKAMHRVVAANLDSRLEGVVVVAYPYLQTVTPDYTVLGQLDRFDADTSGRVVLQLQWAVLTNQGKPLLPPRRSRYEARASDPDDPGAIASAMRHALDQFSEDIARELRSLPLDSR